MDWHPIKNMLVVSGVDIRIVEVWQISISLTGLKAKFFQFFLQNNLPNLKQNLRVYKTQYGYEYSSEGSWLNSNVDPMNCCISTVPEMLESLKCLAKCNTINDAINIKNSTL